MTDYGPLKLHVPQPAVRPGGAPDFASVRIPRAGSVMRPAVDADPETMRDLAYSIIRVLNRDGEAVGPWAGLLSDEASLAGLRDMMLLRAFDARMLMAQRQGKTSFYMQHMGEEAVSCAFRKALLPGDMNFPTYRQAGLLIAAGHSLVDMMCQIYSNERDPLKGRQLPVLYPRRRTGSSRSRATWRRSTSRRSAGPWHRRSRATPKLPGVDRRRFDRRIRLSRGTGLRLHL